MWNVLKILRTAELPRVKYINSKQRKNNVWPRIQYLVSEAQISENISGTSRESSRVKVRKFKK